MPFLYGAISVVLALGLFASGAYLGYKAYPRMNKTKKYEPTEKEKEDIRLMEQQQEAWKAMQNYSAEMAYGMYTNPLVEEVSS